MLPRFLRLSRRGFGSTRGLNRLASAHFSLSYGDRPDSGGMAIVISKKVAKSSVARHLLKRRVLSVLRPYASPARTLVVHAKAGAADLSFAELKDELISLIRSILPEQPTT